jgi:hypothetical protein
MLGHGEPIRVKQGERVSFHVLNASATEIRSLALPATSSRPLRYPKRTCSFLEPCTRAGRTNTNGPTDFGAAHPRNKKATAALSDNNHRVCADMTVRWLTLWPASFLG